MVSGRASRAANPPGGVPGPGGRCLWRAPAICAGLAAMVAYAVAVAQPAVDEAPYDTLILGGRVLDGTGNPWFRADIGVRGDRIAAIGDLGQATGARVIDASGGFVSPGFIDLHTHSETALLEDGDAQSMVRQGVTVNVFGERGSVAPVGGAIEPDPGVSWTTFTGYFDRLAESGTSINVASFVAEGQVRRFVMGYETRPATADELDAMKALLMRSMDEGAMGIVTRFDTGGPVYPDEVIELAKVVSARGGIYASHTGRQGSEQEKEYAFAIRVAEQADIPVHIYHLKIIGESNWGSIERYLRQIEAARDRGLDVTANQYPYTAMHHGWSAFFPVWSQEQGPARFVEYLSDPEARARIKADPEFELLTREHGGWKGIALGSAPGPASRYVGMRLTEIAELRGDDDPAETALTLMALEGGHINGVFHNQSEADLRLALQRPWISVASDGSAVNLEDPTNPHPRAYGSNVRVLGRYVREFGLLTFEEAVRKMTSLPAQILGLRDRGLLREGYFADIVVFDPEHVLDVAMFEAPRAYAAGVPYVLVNGEIVIDDGEHTGARPGRPLLGPGAQRRRDP